MNRSVLQPPIKLGFGLHFESVSRKGRGTLKGFDRTYGPARNAELKVLTCGRLGKMEWRYIALGSKGLC